MTAMYNSLITLIIFCCIQHIVKANLLTDVYSSIAGISVSVGFVSLLSSWGTEYGGLPGNRRNEVEMRWIANDERRHVEDGSGLDFFVHIDTTELPSNLADATSAINAITNAVNTWDNVPCSKNKFNLIIKNDYNGQDIGYTQYVYTDGAHGINETIGDIVFGGFLPSYLFNSGPLQPNGNISVTALTIFFDFSGKMVDFSNVNESQEIAFAEIYFNDFFKWEIMRENETSQAGNYTFDIETVALHEMGHALSQSHFHRPGKIIHWESPPFTLNENDKNSAAMAPLYCGVNHDLHGVDISSHCQIWSSWGLQKQKQTAIHAVHVNAYEDEQAIYNYVAIAIGILTGSVITSIVWLAIFNCNNKNYKYNKVAQISPEYI